jgi:nucleotide-binding universal stress UspA family protein
MYRKILVGYDDSDEAKDAVKLGQQLAAVTGAELVVAGVFQFDPIWGGRDPQVQDADAEFARQVEAAAKAVGAEAEAVPSSSPARGLHELAEEIGADLILVGSASQGRLGQVLAGSVGVALLNGSPCAVGIAPRGYRDRPDADLQSIAVGLDRSAESGQALMAAIELASESRARLKLVSVAEPPVVGYGKGGNAGWSELKAAIEDDTRKRLREACATVPADVDADATMISGDPVEALVDVAGTSGTVLVVGSRGYGPLRRVLLGSVSTPLARLAPCPLIVTPRGMHAVLKAEAEATEVKAAT